MRTPPHALESSRPSPAPLPPLSHPSPASLYPTVRLRPHRSADLLPRLCLQVVGCLTDGDKLAVMIAAVCHDLDHPGVNNDFLAKSSDMLAMRYKAPILERHHLSMTLEMLNDPAKRADISQALKPHEHEELCAMIEQAIMATDMGVHKEICEQLQERAEAVAVAAAEGLPMDKPSFSLDSLEDRIFLVRSIVHTADLSGQAMPKDVAYKFGGGVLTEFHHQYCLEAERNLPLSGWMKDLDHPIGQAKSQLGFITFVVLPLWASMGTIFCSLQPQVERVRARMVEIDFDNIDTWEGFVKGLDPCKHKTPEMTSISGEPVRQPGTEPGAAAAASQDARDEKKGGDKTENVFGDADDLQSCVPAVAEGEEEEVKGEADKEGTSDEKALSADGTFPVISAEHGS